MIKRTVVAVLVMGIAAGGVVPAIMAAQGGEPLARILTELEVPEAATPVRDREGWRRPTRVLVSGGTPERIAELQAVAPGVEFIGGSAAALREAAPTADVLIGSCNRAIIEAGTSIRWVQAFGAGVEDCLEVPAIRERNILLTNVQRVLAPAMAEHVMAMALSFARRISAYRDLQLQGQWRRDPVPAVTLDGRTMLLVGLGGVGLEVGRRAHAMGMTVTAIRNSDRPGPAFVSRVGQSAALMEFVRDADVVVNTLPLTDDTRGMFNRQVFAAMKPGAWFINVGRGGTVVTDDLVAALQNNTIAAAGLDVTDPEPLPAGHPLWSMSNVIITPHVAPNSEVNVESRWVVFRENLRRYVAGDAMLSVVDTTRGY